MKFNRKKFKDSLCLGVFFMPTVFLLNFQLWGDPFNQAIQGVFFSTIYFVITWYCLSDKMQIWEKRLTQYFVQKHHTKRNSFFLNKTKDKTK